MKTKQIQYVMTDRQGKVKTFRLPCQRDGTDEVLTEIYRPENLRGTAKQLLNNYLKQGFSLSNWHVIEFETCLYPIPTRGPAQCQAGHWGGTREHPVA